MTRASHNRRSGMTIIEAMVAIAILAIVMALVWGGFSQTAKNKQLAQDRVDRSHVIRAALERMTRELAAAYVSAQINEDQSLIVMKTCFVGTDRGSRDRLDFTSFSHRRLYRDAHESDQNEISYFLARHPERRETQVLARREQNRIDEDPRRGGRVEVMVEDGGPGIASEQAARVWDRFVRLPQANGMQVTGAGLGLSVVRELAMLHRGAVRLERRDPTGARFVIRLPRVEGR